MKLLKFVNRYRMLELSMSLLSSDHIWRSYYGVFSQVTSTDMNKHVTCYNVYNLGTCIYL